MKKITAVSVFGFCATALACAALSVLLFAAIFFSDHYLDSLPGLAILNQSRAFSHTEALPAAFAIPLFSLGVIGIFVRLYFRYADIASLIGILIAITLFAYLDNALFILSAILFASSCFITIIITPPLDKKTDDLVEIPDEPEQEM